MHFMILELICLPISTFAYLDVRLSKFSASMWIFQFG